jgi:hypothetical protein
MAEPAISIVVSTVDGWPSIRAAFESFQAAASVVGGEVVMIDGSGRPPPPGDALDKTTIWLRRPGASVFQMHEVGYRLARAFIAGHQRGSLSRAARLGAKDARGACG